MIKQASVKGQIERLSRTEGRAWGGFLRIHATLVGQLDAELQAAHRMSLSCYEVLLFLILAPGQRMRLSELAERVLLTLSGMSRLVDRLGAEGLVVRERAEDDRRGAYAVLTEAGARRFREAHATHLAGVRRHFLCHFTEEEMAVLGGFWTRLLPEGERGNGDGDERTERPDRG